MDRAEFPQRLAREDRALDWDIHDRDPVALDRRCAPEESDRSLYPRLRLVARAQPWRIPMSLSVRFSMMAVSALALAGCAGNAPPPAIKYDATAFRPAAIAP